MPDEIKPAGVAELPKTSTWYVPCLRTRKDCWVVGEASQDPAKVKAWLTDRSDDDSNCRVAVIELPL